MQNHIFETGPSCDRLPPKRGWVMSLVLFHRGFYPNLVRAALAGNGVTMVGSWLTRLSHKAWLLLPFGDRGLGPLGDVIFNSSWVFALICIAAILWQSDSPKRRLRIHG
jgi:hypothetical protein